MPRIATILLLLALLGGTSAAFAITQTLKDERLPTGLPRFDRRVIAPTCDCENDRVRMRLRLRSPDRVTAEIVDADGEPVRVLMQDEEVPAGRLRLVWDGRDDAGEVVSDGRYRLRVELEREGRSILLPTTVAVDTQAPRVRLVDVRTSPGRVRIVYRANARAAAVVSVEGEGIPETVVLRGRYRKPGRAAVNWGWRVDGEPVPPGEYTLYLRVRDRAGNLSEPVAIPVERVAEAS